LTGWRTSWSPSRRSSRPSQRSSSRHSPRCPDTRHPTLLSGYWTPYSAVRILDNLSTFLTVFLAQLLGFHSGDVWGRNLFWSPSGCGTPCMPTSINSPFEKGSPASFNVVFFQILDLYAFYIYVTRILKATRIKTCISLPIVLSNVVSLCIFISS